MYYFSLRFSTAFLIVLTGTLTFSKGSKTPVSCEQLKQASNLGVLETRSTKN
jgi:hypothetical protein